MTASVNVSDYFEGIGTKVLSRVDAERLDKQRNKPGSNQHEVGDSANGRLFKQILGDETRANKTDNPFPTFYVWLSDEQETIDEPGHSSWYDTRENNPNRAPEWRLYYQSNPVTELMAEGDRLFFAKEKKNDRLLFIVIPEGSPLTHQMLWLFGLSDQVNEKFGIQDFEKESTRVDFLSRYILELIGIELEDPEANTIDSIIDRFGMTFPGTKEFSALARQTLPEVSAHNDPDIAIMAWLDHEESMFRRLEKRIVAERISQGWIDKNGEVDVDGFIKYSTSTRNRRMSRMGHAFENHLAAIFDEHKIVYEAQKKTEKGKKPDFIFPGIKQYFDAGYSVNLLTMLAAKSTCKDRWPQVLSEAERLEKKHLITLELSISESQTDTMRDSGVQLIVPSQIQSSYNASQRKWLWCLTDFVALVSGRQKQGAAS